MLRIVLAAAAAVAAVVVYAPALRGPFVFDDLYQPFLQTGGIPNNLRWWLIQERPLLMLSFALCYRIGGEDPFWYHLLNLLLHLVNAWLVYRIVNHFTSDQTREAAVFGGMLFLLHPVQTEAVAYVSGGAYGLSALFFLSALSLFLGKRAVGLSWRRSAAVAGLFAAAVATKEHTLTLPVLLLFTDGYWGPGGWREGLRQNYRLHLILAAAGAAGVAVILVVLGISETAGAGIAGVTPWAFFFTQCRLVFTYLRLFLVPLGQTIDPDVPLSHSLFEPGPAAGLTVLVLLLAAAWRYRRRAPLACYGVLVCLLLMAPTASIVPIADPLAERRLYLALLGPLFVFADLLARLRPRTGAAVGLAVLLIAALAAHRRNQVWSSAIALWEDAVEKAPAKLRPRFQLADAYYQDGQCGRAAREYGVAARLGPPDHPLLVNWALALDCAGDAQGSLERLHQAAALQLTGHVYATIGMIHAKNGRREEALRALEQASRLDPHFDMTFFYRGNLHALAGDLKAAAADYEQALKLNARNQLAREALARVRAQLQGR